jgi:hypothetical protein
VDTADRETYFYAEFYDGWVRSFRNVGGVALGV